MVRDPLLSLSWDGRVLSIVSCPDPDRLPATEFYAGLLVPDFPVDWQEAFAGLCPCRHLTEQLAAFVPAPNGVLVVISGLDYATMRLTPQSQIRRL